ncbi:MAG: single-stranded DNA-binding protein [Peptostreptococcaceae bacterium]|nr:single-stranded DNA-binding protein [Peptostreptococcaceae bacterium]
MNQVILIGRLTKDPELRYAQTGTGIASFSLAVHRDFKDKDGERKADFFNITAFGKTAENCANYLAKGNPCAVRGRLQNEQWEKDGEKKYATKVIAEQVEFLTPKGKSGETSESKMEAIDGFRALDDPEVPF